MSGFPVTSITTSTNLQINSLGVGTPASGTAGQIVASSLTSPSSILLALFGSAGHGLNFGVNGISNNVAQIGTNAVVQIVVGIDTHLNAAVTTPAVTSGVAFTPNPSADCTTYFQINTVLAGSYTLTMGPTTGAENTIATAVALVANSDQLVTLRVPGTWKVVLTLVTATLQGGTATCVQN